MTLTATTKTSSRLRIQKILGMKNPAVVEVSPEKSNIFLPVQQFETLQKSFEPLAKKLISETVTSERKIVFCKRRDDCAVIYAFLKLLPR